MAQSVRQSLNLRSPLAWTIDLPPAPCIFALLPGPAPAFLKDCCLLSLPHPVKAALPGSPLHCQISLKSPCRRLRITRLLLRLICRVLRHYIAEILVKKSFKSFHVGLFFDEQSPGQYKEASERLSVKASVKTSIKVSHSLSDTFIPPALRKSRKSRNII